MSSTEKFPIQASVGPNHNKSTDNEPARRFVNNAVKAALTVCALVSLGMSPAMATTTAPVAAKAAPVAGPRLAADLFAGDTWHAISPSWPGTLKFNAKTKEVKLEPVGAATIEAKYTYTVNPPKLGAKSTVVEGTLRMTNAAGQVSVSQFRIENKKTLSLTFQAGQRPETYVRMTPAEEAAEVARLKKALEEGKTKPIR